MTEKDLAHYQGTLKRLRIAEADAQFNLQRIQQAIRVCKNKIAEFDERNKSSP